MSPQPSDQLPPYDEAYVEYLRAHAKVRARHSAYYEKLALLNGGTIALTANLLLGSSHENIRHRYTLATGVALVAVAMMSVLIRNLAETRREANMTTQQYCFRLKRNQEAEALQIRIDATGRVTKSLEKLGVYCTLGGLTFLALVLMLNIVR